MSKHSKPGGGKQHPGDGNDGTHDQKRSVSGNVHVRGEILVEPTPKEALAREATESKHDAHERKKLWWEKATFYVVTVYALLTAVISWQSVRSANAAKSAADTAKDALHVSERAYISIGIPHLDVEKKTMYVPLVNSGHIPSGPVTAIIHEITLEADPSIPKGENGPVEWEWESFHQNRLDSGVPLPLHAVFPRLYEPSLDTGEQVLMVIGSIEYNDGFADTPKISVPFCFKTLYFTAQKELIIDPCNADELIGKVKALDGYPQNEGKLQTKH